jgi:hypothetical protein
MTQNETARSVRLSEQRLTQVEAALRRIKTVDGPPPEWTSADWRRFATYGLAAVHEARHQRWLVEQWRELASAGSPETGAPHRCAGDP